MKCHEYQSLLLSLELIRAKIKKMNVNPIIKENSNHNSEIPQPRSIIPSKILIPYVNGTNLEIDAIIGGNEGIGIIIPEKAREGIATKTAN